MSGEEDRRALKWRREKWRRQWIARFAERQHIARRWIALVDLVDWCAQSTTTASRDEEAKAREVAYQRLTGSVRKGELERDGRSKILYLDTLVTSDGWSPRCRRACAPSAARHPRKRSSGRLPARLRSSG